MPELNQQTSLQTISKSAPFSQTQYILSTKLSDFPWSQQININIGLDYIV